MPGRKWTSQPAAGPAAGRTRAPKNPQKRSLNAFSIASHQNPERMKVRPHRLGDIDEDNGRRKRQKLDGAGSNDYTQERSDDDGIDAEDGSDSEGNEWRLGQVDSDDDSDLDSEEAFGESDDDRFEGFTFRGSSSNKNSKKKKAPNADIDLNENEEDDAGSNGSDEDGDSLGEDAVDLATMLDNDEEESGSEQASKAKSSRKAAASDGEQESNEDSENSEEESDDEGSAFSMSDDEGQGEDLARLSALQSLVSNLPSGSTDQTNKRHQGTDAHESTAPSDYALNASQKLSIADLLPSVTDPGLKKSLKLLSSEQQKAPSKRNGIPGKLEAPLPKRQQDRLDREAAYEKSKETLDRWIDTVKHNRRAEHLSFPLADPSADAAQGRGRSLATTSTQPLTELESAIHEIMQQSGLADQNGKSEEDQIREFEELKANKLPLEEVQARRAELRKARELLFREESRAKRIKKIKSKSYRRVHRKQREREEQAERDALTAAGVEMSEDEAERVHRRRAEERMGGRHKSSKWAKGVKESGRAAWDDDARHGVTEMARRDDDLRRRIEGKTVRNESESGSDLSDEDDQISEGEDEEDSDEASAGRLRRQLDRADGEPTPDGNGRSIGSKLANMKFMQRAEAAQKLQNDAEAAQLRRELAGEETSSAEEDDDSAHVGRRKFGPASNVTTPLQKGTPRNEFEERLDSEDEPEEESKKEDDDVEIILDKESTHKPTSVQARKSATEQRLSRQPKNSTQLPDADTQENPWLVAPAKKTAAEHSAPVLGLNTGVSHPSKSGFGQSKGKPSAEKSGKSAPKSQASGKQQSAVVIGQEEDTSDSEDSEAGNPQLPFVLRNQDLVKKAFAGDEVVADFEDEKKQTAEDEDEKVVDNMLPGWGSWAGAGVSKKQEKRNKGRFLSKEEGIKKDQRKDAKLDRVIINEKRVKKNAKYLASSLPHPFETRQQYERSLRLPVGPEWTTKETFQSATKPRVMVKRGVITPMDRPTV
ncbi:Utp14-domain-containing protein [Xylona heveae TC161]|uniref:Utp14-domain-containing protein n=1 Tax=Xylona heveae (strain CBS 132557 / TC161) TaxID=1328760 RepID=A0A165IH34_XYLHT|nr:Utp14-domain-containing protein [Xylona heveae TC161]KZF24886.1 Utp14-domain-containing protein [Xylona heveae TC161]